MKSCVFCPCVMPAKRQYWRSMKTPECSITVTRKRAWRSVNLSGWRLAARSATRSRKDAMGWLDYHLHEFRLLDRREKQVLSIGIPTDDDPEDRPVVPGWDVPLSRYFERRGWHAPPAMYAYDFGDDWEHVLVHEGMESAEESLTYPRCVSGARRCPPEDCGGVHGYEEFLKAIASRRHPEHQSMVEWVGGSYEADAFDPKAVA